MAKRRKFSRWRRLPGVYRSGDEKPPDPYLEPQRLSLYISGVALDRAEAQAVRLGYESVQDYCGELVVRAIDAENVRGHMAEVEAKRGTLEGLHEIADDPEYLAELSAASSASSTSSSREPSPGAAPQEAERPEPGPLPLALRLGGGGLVGAASGPEAETSSPGLSQAAQVVLRHSGQAGDDAQGFLRCLRRGDNVPPAEIAELAQALHQLEQEYRGASAMDRRLSFALHRLAFESQVLHTDAWPGSFDHWTVDTLRAVQEAVERILSGQDIRYGTAPESAFAGPNAEAPR